MFHSLFKSVIILMIAGFSFSGIAFSQDPSLPYRNPDLPIKQRVSDLVSRMTLEEKVGQMLFTAPAVPRLGVPAYNWWNECLHGVARNGRATIFPQAIGMAATWDTALIYRVARAISLEARAKYNVSVANGLRGQYQGLTFWTPNINIFRDPRWGRGQETYGEDPFLTARIGVNFVRGLQGDHPRYLQAAGCAKHYAVHNGPEGLRHEFNVEVSRKDLWETYLPAFEALVTEAKVEGVMGAYNRVNGHPCSAHPYLIKEVLRERWGFDGYFVSDCWAIVDFYEGHKVVETPAQAAALAAERGCNLNCGSTFPELTAAVEAGLIAETEIDRRLKELLPTRFRLGLFDPPGTVPFDTISPAVIRSPAHVALARETAASSMVLLKNEGQLLPLPKDIPSLYVCGPTAAHMQALLANYYGLSEDMRTILEGIVGKVSPQTSVQYSQGALLDEPNRNPIDWFSGAAGEVDVTIACLGISQLIEGEEGESIASRHKGDRKDIGLPPNQIEFLRKIRANAKKLVVVLTGGSAIACPEVYEMADALLYAWYPGEQGGAAVGDILFGDAGPAGRLPVTVPFSVDDLPPYEDYSMTNRTYRYGNTEPLFPFGFGLSYTTFSYEDLQFSRPTISKGESLEVTATVTNSGDRTGEEVVQLYLRDEEASVDSPLYTLRGFQRISLAPGASRQVRFRLYPKDLEVVDENGERRLESGRFTVFVSGALPSRRSLALGAAPFLEGAFAVE